MSGRSSPEKNFIFFPEQSDGDLIDLIGDLGQFVRLPAQAHLKREGEVVDSFYYLVDGEVSYSITSCEGEMKSLGFVSSGCFFGAGPITADFQARVSMTATRPSTVLVIPRVRLLARMVENPGVAVAIVQATGDKLYAWSQQLEQMSFLEPRARIAELLLALERRAGGPTPEMTHEQIAGIVGCNRVTVTRVLNQLRNKGLIEVDDRRITVVDPKGLEAFAVA